MFSENEALEFKTPEAINKHQFENKVNKTAKADKKEMLEVKSSTKSNFDFKGKSINLSDILKSTEYDQSEYQNLLEEGMSNDLASLSHNDFEASKHLNEIPNMFESKKTPCFPHKAESKIQHLRYQAPDNSDEKHCQMFEGRYLNMSLGDIPEEYDETCTISDNFAGGFDKILSYNSNTNSKSDNYTTSQDAPSGSINMKGKRRVKRADRSSGDSRFSTYMCSDNKNKGYISYEMSNDKPVDKKSLNDSQILQPKKHTTDEMQKVKRHKSDTVGTPADKFCKENFENNENYSLISNSGNKDMTNYVSHKDAIKPRRIFGNLI